MLIDDIIDDPEDDEDERDDDDEDDERGLREGSKDLTWKEVREDPVSFLPAVVVADDNPEA